MTDKIARNVKKSKFEENEVWMESDKRNVNYPCKKSKISVERSRPGTGAPWRSDADGVVQVESYPLYPNEDQPLSNPRPLLTGGIAPGECHNLFPQRQDGLTGQQTWAQPLGWPLSHQVH